VRKIGVPLSLELAMGAVDGGAPIIVRNEDVILGAGIDESQFKAVWTLSSRKSSAGASAIGWPRTRGGRRPDRQRDR
jgi:predicted phosphoribosyltransferase